jgi:hypothetical protein
MATGFCRNVDATRDKNLGLMSLQPSLLLLLGPVTSGTPKSRPSILLKNFPVLFCLCFKKNCQIWMVTESWVSRAPWFLTSHLDAYRIRSTIFVYMLQSWVGAASLSASLCIGPFVSTVRILPAQLVHWFITVVLGGAVKTNLAHVWNVGFVYWILTRYMTWGNRHARIRSCDAGL